MSEKKSDNFQKTPVFYSILNIDTSFRKINGILRNFLKEKKIYDSCFFLFRNNRWNDYGLYSNFEFFYYSKEEDAFSYLGSIKIISVHVDKGENGRYVVLPTKFENLPKKEYFSRGCSYFYKNIDKDFSNFKKIILDSLNDVEYFGYTATHIEKISETLYFPLHTSLFREDFWDSYSASASASKEILDEILSSLDSFSDENKNSKMVFLSLYASIISVLESYLYYKFESILFNNYENLYNFLNNYFYKKNNKKYSLKDLGDYKEKFSNLDDFIQNEIKISLQKISFHNMQTVISLFKNAGFEIDRFNLYKFNSKIKKRHDIIHRAGKTLSGKNISVSITELKELISEVKEFINDFDKNILKKS